MFKIFLVAALAISVQAVEFKIKNLQGGDIWVGVQGNPGHTNLNNGGFVLSPNSEVSLNAEDNWAGRFWARTWCDTSTNHCETGDCGNKLECDGNGGAPPASLAEITLKGADGLDFYDLSLVDGYNSYVSIEPINGEGDGGEYSCKKSSCHSTIIEDCPDELKVIGSSGDVIACNSACNAFNTDQYCCRNDHDQPETCQSSDWPVDYPKFFKDRCPDAYSYAYDDHKSTYTCKASVYEVVFG